MSVLQAMPAARRLAARYSVLAKRDVPYGGRLSGSLEHTWRILRDGYATFSRLAILAVVFVAYVCQAQTSRSIEAYHSRTDNSGAELNREEAGPDKVVASTNVRLSKIIAGIEFLGRIDKGLIEEFDKAWRVSGDGTTGREGVVLIFRTKGGSYRGVSQGFTSEYEKFTFNWKPNALAIVHTHPNNCDPKPSPQDERAAEKYDVPIFTITISGMYVYNPTTRMTGKVVNDLDWLKLSKWQEIGAKLKGCGTQLFGSCY
ncbi:MAG: hypothetical protein WAV20_13070 [Blastocatellia bacterium]